VYKELFSIRDKFNTLLYSEMPAMKRTIRDLLQQGVNKEDEFMNKISYIEGSEVDKC
jgi:hypothetical protein